MTRTVQPETPARIGGICRSRASGRELLRHCLIDFPSWSRKLPTRACGYVVRLKSKAHALMQYLP